MSREQKTNLLVLIIVVGFTIAIFYHYVLGVYLSNPWPANTFLHRPEVRFRDFTLVVQQSAGLAPFDKNIGGFAGAPFPQLIGYLYSLIPSLWVQLLLFFGTFFSVFIFTIKHFLFGKQSKITSYQLLTIFVIAFLTYPVLFALDRANFDLIACASILLFAFTYSKGQFKASVIFLALAVAIKPMTIVLGLIYLFDKRLKFGLLMVFNVIFLSVASLALFRDGLFKETIKYFSGISHAVNYLSAGNQQTFCTDLYALLTYSIKYLGDMFGIDKGGAGMYLPSHPETRIIYLLVAMVIFTYFTLYLWKQKKPFWQTLAVLTILLILLPYNSADYRLTYLFAPMLIYISIDGKTRYDHFIVILFGLLLVPKNYFALPVPQNIGSITNIQLLVGLNIGIIINPLLLIGMLLVIIPDAFSLKSVLSVLRLVYNKMRGVFGIRPIRQRIE